MNYKIISMDFDGTLLTSNKKVTNKTQNTILKYKNNSYIIVGVTARNLSSVKLVININMFDFLIINNGAYIYDVKNNKTTCLNSFNEEITRKITDCFKNIAARIDYCTLSYYYNYINKAKDSRDFIIKIDNIDKISEPISRINIFLKNNEDIIRYKEFINNNFTDLDAYIMQDTDQKNNIKWISLNLKKVNKFEALKFLCNKLNVPTEHVIFFGDNENDLTIINGVGLGVAMENAIDEVKKQAKAVTLSNNDDGIANFLENNL